MAPQWHIPYCCIEKCLTLQFSRYWDEPAHFPDDDWICTSIAGI